MNYTVKESFAELKQLGIVNSLYGSQLFRGMSRDELETIAEITVIKSLPKRSYLFHAGEQSTGFYIVKNGAINLHQVSPVGKERVINIVRPGESFGEETLALDNVFSYGARAEVASGVLQVQRTGFLAVIRRQPELALKVLGALGAHLKVVMRQLGDLSLQDVETRLANWLVSRCPNPPNSIPVTIELPTTKRVLAAELGAASETLSRTLCKFRQRRLISVRGRRITVISSAGLDGLAHRQMTGLCFKT